MKKRLIPMVCLCLMFSMSFASEEVTDKNTGEAVIDSTGESTEIMTLEEAVSYAIKNNAQIIDIKRTEKDQKDVYDDAKDEYRSWQNKMRSGGYSFETVQEYLDCYGYGLKTATLNYNNFLATKTAAEKSLEYSIKNMAYSVKKLEDSIVLLEETVDKQMSDVNIAEVKIKYNMITENEYKEILAKLDTSRLQLIELKSTLETLKISLKKAMGFDVLKKLEITLPEYEVNELKVENLEELIENSLSTNKYAIAAEIDYNQKDINNMLATKTKWFGTRDEIKDAKEAFTDAQSRLDNEINSIKENLTVLYQKVKTNEETTTLAKTEYERAKSQFEQAQVMYAIGMISKNTNMGYKVALKNAENIYNSAVIDNILLNERWNVAISVGDVVGI